ncbi:unnamed protein product [Cuscuta europaea]|uniref:Uncharacterized protein n=1 Tax=Cuscuta europaea TaxID=41803 RepID=A0A9P1ECC5_CUSEU|nr:unnamed protein product [Cuscuta europaea]
MASRVDRSGFQISLTPLVSHEGNDGNDDIGLNQTISIAYEMLEGSDIHQIIGVACISSNNIVQIKVNKLSTDVTHLPADPMPQNERHKRKAMEPKRYTPGSEAIKKAKKSDVHAATTNPLTDTPFLLINNPSKRQQFHNFVMKRLLRANHQVNVQIAYTPDIDKDFLIELDPGLCIESKTWLYKLY